MRVCGGDFQIQFWRRNLSAYDRSILALKLKPAIAAKAKENLIAGAEMTNTGLQKSVKAVNTQKEIAKVAGVSHDTIAKVEKIKQQAAPEIKADRAQISALKKLGVAQEVVKIKLHDAQITAEQVTFAKIKLGELLADLPKATKDNNLNGRAGKENKQIDSRVDLVKPKAESIAELGITQKQAERLQQMAKNPEAVQSAMTKARENGDVVSQAQILNEIKQTKRKEEIQKQAEEIEQRAAPEIKTALAEKNFACKTLKESGRQNSPYL